MIEPGLLSIAYFLDVAIGDPSWLPHPVRLMGKTIEMGERFLHNQNRSSAFQLFAGGLLTVTVTVGAYAGTWSLIHFAERLGAALNSIVTTYLAFTT
ncbi:MAG: cobalamin biosynthesis protein, partial [Blastocatellia bacterium]